MEVRRISQSQSRFLKSVNQKLATDTTLQSEDVIYVMGDFDRIHQIAQELDLYIIDSHTTEESGKNKENSLDFYDIGIAEILLMPNSRLINQSVKDAGFRDKYNLNVLGIRRKKEYILHDIKDEKIHSGDVLLVQGTWNDIARLSEDQSEWVVLGQPLTEAAKVTLDYKAPVAATIMVLMIAAMMFDFIPIAPVTAVMIAGLLMVLTGCFRNVESAYKTINWESIVLIAAMLPMSLALEKTGASKVISHSLVTGLGQYGPVILLAGVYFTTSLMTDVYQQYSYSSITRSHRNAIGYRNRSKPLSFPICCNRCSKHVFCISVLHTSERISNAGRTIYIYGLCESRIASSDYYRSYHDLYPASYFSVLNPYF